MHEKRRNNSEYNMYSLYMYAQIKYRLYISLHIQCYLRAMNSYTHVTKKRCMLKQRVYMWCYFQAVPFVCPSRLIINFRSLLRYCCVARLTLHHYHTYYALPYSLTIALVHGHQGLALSSSHAPRAFNLSHFSYLQCLTSNHIMISE